MTPENQVLEIRKNSSKRMTPENQVLEKNQNLQDLQIIQIILEKNYRMSHNQTLKKIALILKERKNLKIEVIDLKILALKNIAKKGESLRVF